MYKRSTKKQSFTAENSTLTRTNLNPQLRLLEPSGLPRPIVVDSAISQPAHLRRAASEPFPLQVDINRSNGWQTMSHRRKSSAVDTCCDMTVDSVSNSPISVVSQTSKSGIPRHFRTFLRRSSSSSSSSLSSLASSPQTSPEHAFISSGIDGTVKHMDAISSSHADWAINPADNLGSRVPRHSGNQIKDSGFPYSPTLDILKSCLRGTLAKDEQAKARRMSLPSSPSRIPVPISTKRVRRGHHRSVSFALEDEASEVVDMVKGLGIEQISSPDSPRSNLAISAHPRHLASVTMYLAREEATGRVASMEEDPMTADVAASIQNCSAASGGELVLPPVGRPQQTKYSPNLTDACGAPLHSSAQVGAKAISYADQKSTQHQHILYRLTRPAHTAAQEVPTLPQIAAAAMFAKFELVLGLTLAAVWLTIGRLLGDKS